MIKKKKKHGSKCSPISRKVMYGWPFPHSKKWIVCQPRHAIATKVLFITPRSRLWWKKGGKKIVAFWKTLWAWSGGLSPLQTMPYKILFKFISARPFFWGDTSTNHWPTDTQLEVMRQLRRQATLLNRLSLTLRHWINIMPPMRVRHWAGVKRELGTILS